MKRPASMYENSGSKFFITATKIQSGSDAFEKLMLFMAFLTSLGVTGISFSFTAVLEEKAGKEIPESPRLKVFRKDFSTQFCFIRSRRQHQRPIKGGIAIFNFYILAIRQKARDPSFWEKINSFLISMS